MPPSLAIVCPWVPPEASSTTEYVAQVARTLATDAPVHVVWVGQGGQEVAGAASTVSVAGGVGAILAALDRLGVERVVIQYSPYLWTRSGFDLTAALLALRLRWRGTPADVLFHELWVPAMLRPVGALRGLFQRVTAGLAARAARRAVVTSRERLGELSRVGGRALALVPMTSLVPVVPLTADERARLRAELGLADGELALVVFGFEHDSRPTAGLTAVRAALDGAGIASRLVVIGTARVPGVAGWTVELGYCAAERVSRSLSACDVFLAPFADGVSTRRTSVAAALAHGLPVVTTAGIHTDPALWTPGVVALAPADDAAAFAAQVLEVARSATRRSALAAAGRELFARELALPRHAASLWAVHAS